MMKAEEQKMSSAESGRVRVLGGAGAYSLTIRKHVRARFSVVLFANDSMLSENSVSIYVDPASSLSESPKP